MNPTSRYVTGSEVGLNGAEQIRIALEIMIQNGGTAQMKQITEAFEAKLLHHNPTLRLSEQGKASLRFFVNKVAVEAGYVYKHDQRSTGWRITPKGRDYIASVLPIAHLSAKMLTPIGHDFQLALSDVYTLLDADKQISKDASASAAFIRSGIILTVTAWETFIEDTIKAHFAARIATAAKAEEVANTFNAVAAAWLSKFGDKRPAPHDIIKWTGDGWKMLLSDYFNAEIALFNTPKSDNIIALFKRYIGFDIKSVWKWYRMTPDEACTKLDELIMIRGELVHRGRTSADPLPQVDRDQLITMTTLVEQLAWTTEVELNSKLRNFVTI